jgi:hypothetical protein
MTFKEQLFLFIAQFVWWKRYAISLFAITILVFLWWVCGVRSLYRELATRNMEQIQFQKIKNQANIVKQSAQKNVMQFEQKRDSFFVCKSTGDVVDIAIQNARGFKLQLLSSNVATTQTYEKFFVTDMTFVLEGDFFAMLSFFESLSSYSNINCQHCTLENAASGFIHCTVVVRLYIPQ